MEFDEIVVKESPGLCRCCLSEGCYKDLGSEYPWMEDTEVYADMLLECFDISISQHNDGPNGPNRLICEVCITRLRDACNFKKQVLDSEKKFVDMVGRGEFRPKGEIMVYESQMKAEVPVDVASVVATDVEYLEDDMDYGDIPDTYKDETIEASDVTAVPLPAKGKRGRPRKNSTVVKAEKKPKVEEKPRTSKAVSKDEYAQNKYENCASERRRKNMQIIFNSTSIIPFKWRGKYLCFYCGKDYADYRVLKTHTKSHGQCSTKDYSLKIIKGNHIEVKLDISAINCEICNEPFAALGEIIDHLIIKHSLEYDKTVEIPFQEYILEDKRCQFCGDQFAYFGYLITHINTCHPQHCFICDDCGMTFNKKRDLALHSRHNHRRGGYTCDGCSENFPSRDLWRKHTNNIHFRTCKRCNSSFASFSLLQKHIQVEHSVNSGKKCPHCAKECHSRQGLIQHLRQCKLKIIVKRDKAAMSLLENSLEPKKPHNLSQKRQNIVCVLNMSTVVPFKFLAKFSCFHCSKKFTEFEELKDHTVLEHPLCNIKSKCITDCKGERTSVKIDVTSLSCRVCCQPMENLDELIDHIVTKHKANYDKSVTGCFEQFKLIKDNIPCPHCPTVFRYFSTLLRHMNSEHSNNARICDFCGRSFKNAANLNVHIGYAHTGTCECDVCGLMYKNQWCLARHKAKCHDAKDYKCPKCPEQFQSQYHKQKHLIQVHDTGHKCSHCGRMFTRNSFMKDHIRRTHLKEKNVPCSVCSERFFDNYLLKLHMVKHDGERKFTCSVCGKAFLRRSNLNSHMVVHKKYKHVEESL